MRALIIALPLLLTGCASTLSSESYTDAQAGEVAYTYEGNIVNARNVQVKRSDSLEEGGFGGLAGGVAGGIGGAQIGGGSGRVAAGAGGAVLGALLGSLIQQEASKQTGTEYIVKLNNGELRTIVQSLTPRLNPGQAVFVIESTQGRSRIVPNYNN